MIGPAVTVLVAAVSIAVVTTVAWSIPVAAEPSGAEQEVNGPEPEGGERIAIDGDTALVAGWRSTHTDVYRRLGGTWTKVQELPQGHIRLAGDVVAIGVVEASVDAHSLGHILMYRWDGSAFVLEQRLDAPDDILHSFATGFALEDDRLVVADSGSSVPSGGGEKLLVYDHDGDAWHRTATISRDDAPGARDRFGRATTLSSDTIATTDSDHSVFVFVEVDGVWQLQGGFGPAFGGPSIRTDSADLDGDVLVIGDAANNVVRVFVRTDGTWTWESTLRQPGGSIGWSVAVSGDVLVAGVTIKPHPVGDRTGLAAVYRHSGATWERTALLWPRDHATHMPYSNVFGRVVDASGRHVLVGAKNVSSSYFYDLDRLAPVQGGELHGWVTAGKPPVEGVVVTLMADHPRWRVVDTVVTGAGGYYQFDDIAAGDYRLRFFDPSRRHARVWWSSEPSYRRADVVTVRSAEATRADQDLTLTRGELRGRVHDAKRAPVSGAVVCVYGTDPSVGYVGGAVTGPDGWFALTGLPPGTYLVQFVDPDRGHRARWHGGGARVTSAVPVEVPDGGTAWIGTVLTRRGTG